MPKAEPDSMPVSSVTLFPEDPEPQGWGERQGFSKELTFELGWSQTEFATGRKKEKREEPLLIAQHILR